MTKYISKSVKALRRNDFLHFAQGYILSVDVGGRRVLYNIEDLRSIISPISRQHGVESVSVFGSYSRGTASASSDVDLKIESKSRTNIARLEKEKN